MGLVLPDDGLSDEQREFREMLRRFLESHAGIDRARSALDAPTGVAASAWGKAQSDFGLGSLATPEALGGQGFGYREMGLALAEVGRVLAPIPLFGVGALLVPMIEGFAASGDVAAELSSVIAGEVASLACFEGTVDSRVSGFETRCSADERLSGEKRFVLDADVAKSFFVVAESELQRVGLFEVRASDDGVAVQRLETLDPTRRLFSVRFDSAKARLVGVRENALERIESALDISTALLCAEMVGGMERVLETSVDHASSRYQFGRAIGSFQAVKHKAANMLIDFEGARTAVRAALESLDDRSASREERAVAVSVAKAHVSAAFVRTATESIQIQGGVGYTWEYDAHLFFRRAQSSALLLGDPHFHEERVAGLLVAQLAKEDAA